MIAWIIGSLVAFVGMIALGVPLRNAGFGAFGSIAIRLLAFIITGY